MAKAVLTFIRYFCNSNAEFVECVMRDLEKSGLTGFDWVRLWFDAGLTKSLNHRVSRSAACESKLDLPKAQRGQAPIKRLKLEPFKKYCSHAVSRMMESGLFGLWLRFGSVTGCFKPAPSPKLRPNPKILAPHGHSIS
jgi:hypothetical protein